MADIKLQPRSTNALWLILAIIALLIVVWTIFAWVDSSPGAYGVGLVSSAVRMFAGMVSTPATT